MSIPIPTTLCWKYNSRLTILYQYTSHEKIDKLGWKGLCCNLHHPKFFIELISLFSQLLRKLMLEYYLVALKQATNQQKNKIIKNTTITVHYQNTWS